MRTTININDALLDELKERSLRTRRPLTKVLDEVLRRGLAEPTGRGQAVKIRTYKVGLKPAYRGLSLNQLYDQLEAEDHFKAAEE